MGRDEDSAVLLKLDHGDDRVVLDAASGDPASVRGGDGVVPSRPTAPSPVVQAVPTSTAALTAHSAMARVAFAWEMRSEKAHSVVARTMPARSARAPSATARSAVARSSHVLAARSTAGA